MRVLITGGLGFIGRACVPRLLARGCRAIRVLDSLEASVHGTRPDVEAYTRDWGREVEVTIGSVTDRGQVTRLLSDVDVVLHLASLTSVPGSMRDSAGYSDANITGTAQLRDALVARGSLRRLVLVSSRAVYGEGPYRCSNDCGEPGLEISRSPEALRSGLWDPLCPVCGKVPLSLAARETGPLRPTSVYGITKLAQEQLLQSSLPLHAAELAIFRLQNVYGPGQNRAVPDVGVANLLAQAILRGEGANLFEDGEPTRDFVFIDDVADLLVDATLRGLGGERCEVFNVGTGRSISLRQLAEELFRIAERPSRIRISGEYRIGDVRHCRADVARLAGARDWSPVPVSEGLRRLIEWLRATH